MSNLKPTKPGLGLVVKSKHFTSCCSEVHWETVEEAEHNS